MTRQYLVQRCSVTKSLQGSIAEACIPKIWQPKKQLSRHRPLSRNENVQQEA